VYVCAHCPLPSCSIIIIARPNVPRTHVPARAHVNARAHAHTHTQVAVGAKLVKIDTAGTPSAAPAAPKAGTTSTSTSTTAAAPAFKAADAAHAATTAPAVCVRVLPLRLCVRILMPRHSPPCPTASSQVRCYHVCGHRSLNTCVWGGVGGPFPSGPLPRGRPRAQAAHQIPGQALAAQGPRCVCVCVPVPHHTIV
jgi:hypothetical protein